MAVRSRERPSTHEGATALLALLSIADPSPEQQAGAALLACALIDLHALTRDS